MTRKVVFMKEIIKTQTFHACMKKIRDENAKARISARIDERLCVGLAGDRKHLGGGLKELKIHYGKGYRVYYVENDNFIVILWAGHKGTQTRDIKKAKELAEEGKEQWLLN